MTCREAPFRSGGVGDSCVHLNTGLRLFELEALERGWIKQDLSGLVIQWSWRPWSKRSAATHRGGGVGDVKWFLTNTDTKMRTAFSCGLLPFHRTSDDGFDEHGHWIALGCDNLDPSAQKQVASYFERGMNGLRTERRFRGPANMPYITVQTAMKRHMEQLARKDDDMPSAQEVAKAFLAEEIDGHSLEWHFRVLRENAQASAQREKDLRDALATISARLK